MIRLPKPNSPTLIGEANSVKRALGLKSTPPYVVIRKPTMKLIQLAADFSDDHKLKVANVVNAQAKIRALLRAVKDDSVDITKLSSRHNDLNSRILGGLSYQNVGSFCRDYNELFVEFRGALCQTEPTWFEETRDGSKDMERVAFGDYLNPWVSDKKEQVLVPRQNVRVTPPHVMTSMAITRGTGTTLEVSDEDMAEYIYLWMSVGHNGRPLPVSIKLNKVTLLPPWYLSEEDKNDFNNWINGICKVKYSSGEPITRLWAERVSSLALSVYRIRFIVKLFKLSNQNHHLLSSFKNIRWGEKAPEFDKDMNLVYQKYEEVIDRVLFNQASSIRDIVTHFNEPMDWLSLLTKSNFEVIAKELNSVKVGYEDFKNW